MGCAEIPRPPIRWRTRNDKVAAPRSQQRPEELNVYAAPEVSVGIPRPPRRWRVRNDRFASPRRCSRELVLQEIPSGARRVGDAHKSRLKFEAIVNRELLRREAFHSS